MPTEKLNRLATVSLILTPEALERFGKIFPDAGISMYTAAPAKELYTESIQRSFAPTSKARTLPEFNERWSKGIVRYSKAYNSILDVFIRELGPSRFRVAYLKAISETHGEFEKLSIAVSDITDMYRRHVANSINIATNFDEVMEDNEPEAINRADALLRESNFGITLMFLLLTGKVSSPMWILLNCSDRIRQSLTNAERTLRLPSGTPKLSGSLRFEEGVIDLFPGGQTK
jgi:hypothetical protein